MPQFVLRKNATVKSLDFIVPVMAVCYFVITVGIMVMAGPALAGVLVALLAAGVVKLSQQI